MDTNTSGTQTPTTPSEQAVRDLFVYLVCFEDEDTSDMTLAQVVAEFGHIPSADIGTAILEGETDWLVQLDALKAHLPRTKFDDVCAAMDICPTHVTDTDTCADDALACEAGQR